MMYFRVTLSKLTVADHTEALNLWRSLPDSARMLIGGIVTETPMTAAQYDRLPTRLRAIVNAPNRRMRVAA